METTAHVSGNIEDREYTAFLDRIRARLLVNTTGGQPLFTTNVEGLWDVYLAAFGDEDERQFHTCHACRKFIEQFGGLVVINTHGRTTSALWDVDDAPPAYELAIETMQRRVNRAKVTGVFLSPLQQWGTPKTGPWTHFAVLSPSRPFKHAVLTAGQKMAEKREDFGTVMRALAEFDEDQLGQVVNLLNTDALYRSEKVLGPAKWLHEVQLARFAAGKHGQRARENVVWRAVASAPAGFCHPRSSMIGTLLDDLAAGMHFEEVAARFRKKMHPLEYQRPKAAPTSGAIAQAEKIVAGLEAAGSLARRFARLEDLQAVWKPVAAAEPPVVGGVFSHLKPRKASSVNTLNVPPQTMTWEKFQRVVLPTVQRIEILAPDHGPFTSLVTAVNTDAPPILQWDSEEKRNPVSWYFWHGGASARQFGLSGGHYYPVTAVTLKPSMWNGGFEHHGKGVFFIIEGAKETRFNSSALFPETLRNEFHGIRSVIEAYSKSSKIQEPEAQTAAGLGYDFTSRSVTATLLVWSNGQRMAYRLDRWD
jgi:hypothetical protein